MLALVAVSVALVGGAAAWACTAQPAITLEAPAGPAGSNLVVAGRAFSGPVDIRWNTLNGPVLATVADGTSFAVPVQIPADARPDVYYVVAVAPSGAGKVAQTFEVTTAAGARATGSPWAATHAPGVTGATGPVGNRGQLGLGIALLSVGLITLFSGAVIVGLGRRRATSGATPRH